MDLNVPRSTLHGPMLTMLVYLHALTGIQTARYCGCNTKNKVQT